MDQMFDSTCQPNHLAVHGTISFGSPLLATVQDNGGQFTG
jgi:hypothetical protein